VPANLNAQCRGEQRMAGKSWLLGVLGICACTAPGPNTLPAAAPAPLTAGDLLAYLDGLAGSTRHVLSGQHSSYWDSDPMDYVQAVRKQTGKTVAILGTSLDINGSTEDGVGLSNQWLRAGGIVLLSFWPLDPFTGRNDNDRDIRFSDLAAPGTAAHRAWFSYLDGVAVRLKQLRGPVLFRPFAEMNGNWSWWGAQPPAQFIAVWQQMHDYLVQTKGLSNLLWVYNVNAGKGKYADYYPGPQFVDVVSMDSYPPAAADVPMYDALLALGKPIIYAEVGVTNSNNSVVAPFSADNSQLLAVVKAQFPKVVAVVFWCQNFGIPRQNGAAALLGDPAIINLSDLPPGL
jgi:mannan endo-1,4-beta-mannosidase